MNQSLASIKRFFIPAVILTIGLLVTQCAPDKAKMEAEKINSIIDSMSLEQKSKLLIGANRPYEMPDSIAERYGRRRPDLSDFLIWE